MSTLESRQKIVYWRGVVNRLRESKLTVSEFSKKNKISPGKLSYWRTKITEIEKADPFVEVKSRTIIKEENNISLSIDDVITINFSSPPSPEWISELISSVRKVA